MYTRLHRFFFFSECLIKIFIGKFHHQELTEALFEIDLTLDF
jgi:hypothetical protein